jgi:hypothetical protein
MGNGGTLLHRPLMGTGARIRDNRKKSGYAVKNYRGRGKGRLFYRLPIRTPSQGAGMGNPCWGLGLAPDCIHEIESHFRFAATCQII